VIESIYFKEKSKGIKGKYMKQLFTELSAFKEAEIDHKLSALR
jgi:hypothetical protein